jgi:hypothetical protein
MCRKTVEEEKSCTSLIRGFSKTALAFWAAAALLHMEGAEAKTPVSIEFVLAVDTSKSVDGFEFGLMMKGISHAFRTPEIINLIGHLNGVAVTLLQWNSDIDESYMIPWHLLKGPASVLLFADKVDHAECDPIRHFTGVGGAIKFGVRQIAENAFDGRQLKIDVAGDGRNNFGVSPSIRGQVANTLGIVVNGLPIITSSDYYSYDLKSYYREEVIHGPGAFIKVANDYDDFSRAFLRKLQRELSPLLSQENSAPGARVQKAQAR